MSLKAPITRRDALKLLTAASGAVLGSAVLPGKWLKPVVETGVLPVHAQASNTVGLAGLTAIQEYTDAHYFTASFNYTDTLGEVDATWTIHAAFTAEGSMPYDGNTLAAIGATVGGDGFSGSITYTYSDNTCIYFQPASTDTANIFISKGSRASNVVTDSVTEILIGDSIRGSDQVHPAK